MTGKRGTSLLDTMLFTEMFTLNRAWTGLTNAELHWEPLAGSWGVHRREDCSTPNPFPTDGDWVADFDDSLERAADDGKANTPLTTIAWLFWHVGSTPSRLLDLDFLGGTKPTDSAWTSPYIVPHPVFATADEAVTSMRDGWKALARAIRDSSDEQLEQPTRFWGYGGQPGPETIGAQVIAAALHEISHHGTQMCAIRDLYALSGGAQLAVT